jgi:hypothetical protein
MQSAQKLISHLFTHYGLKIRNYGENCDKNGQKHQNVYTTGRFSEKRSMKYFQNNIFTTWEGSLEKPHHQFNLLTKLFFV